MRILYIFFSFFVLLSAGCGFIIPYDSTTTSTSVATTTTANDGTTTTIFNNSSSSSSTSVVSTTINKSSSSTTSTSTTVGGVLSRKESIVNKWNSLKPKFSDTSCYEISPGTYSNGKLISPYSIGKLKSNFIKDALNTVNFVRFLAYLPDDVILDDDLITKAQHGSVLLCASSFSHTPAKPADMNEDFYKICYSSTSSSNIAYGYSTLEKSIKDGYMSDADVSNIDRVGHRRWILNPKLFKTGFGFSYKYMTMQVFDQSRVETFDYDYISWPSKDFFPSDFFKGKDPWSVTLNPKKYSKPVKSSVKVKLTSNDKVWNFSEADSNKSGKYFNVETSGYGVNNCIIFRPDGITSYSGLHSVEISGIKDLSGNDKVINYALDFFSIQ